MRKQLPIWTLLALIIGLVLTACNGLENEPEDSGAGDILPPMAVLEAQEALANDLNVPVEEVEILSQEQEEWSDSCLGLGGIAESCLTVITPGWRVMLEVDGTTYEVRTDELGDVVRIAE